MSHEATPAAPMATTEGDFSAQDLMAAVQSTTRIAIPPALAFEPDRADWCSSLSKVYEHLIAVQVLHLLSGLSINKVLNVLDTAALLTKQLTVLDVNSELSRQAAEALQDELARQLSRLSEGSPRS